ncbi:MarR family transcriptional regulator [Deinococcus sp. Arct2-2]|uniref:MarR family winged helix-turn-helix transcriptional regulator n=1 Tax=Deinococcus sp. Arct2-2 TaxID=2568653 RepID=UPI0010A31D19|nr:helix-turn-helix domain-containing protein [Deinococcus sp. Arct2-2]THF66679.1 MarR family transcriptional regulator [Deinococcus sp. Arct2-2]
MTKRTNQEQVVNDLGAAVFQLSGRLVEVGNRLVEDLGLTEARWQVLGAIASSPLPLPVAHLARHMGLSRQAVQRLVDLLADQGLVSFVPNPHHQRAKWVVLTAQGQAAEAAAQERWRPWARQLEAALGGEHLATALDVLRRMDAFLATALPPTGGETDPEEVDS